MVLGRNSNQQVTVNVGNSVIENTEEEKLLGVVIDKQLNFETHITELCQKAGNKLFALARISKYMDTNKLRILMRCFVISQFQYCPLAWMFHSRHLNNKINKIHERALRIAYKDYESSFSTLLERDTSVTIHSRNLQILMTEMFQTKENLSPPFMKEIFLGRNITYNLRHNNNFRGFRQGYRAQHALVRLLEKFKISLDEGGKAGTVLMVSPRRLIVLNMIS